MVAIRCAARLRTSLAHGMSAGLALAVLCAGCKSGATDPFLAHQKSSAATGETEKETEPAAESVASDSTPHDDEPLDLAMLANDGWAERAMQPYAVRDDADLRWHNASLDPLLHCADAKRPDLADSLAAENPVVVANAAILMAHWGVGDPTTQLAAAVRNKTIRLQMRCAAAEALGVMHLPSPRAAICELLPQFAGSTEPVAKPNTPLPLADLHADLIRALGKHTVRGDEKWFTAALRSPAWNVRYEGLMAWSAVRDQPLPPMVIDLRSDSDPRLRAAALRAIAAHHDPHALEYLQQALSDRVTEVHATAIAALGELGTREAIGVLGKLKSERSELSRAASVTALAAAGLRDEIEAAAKDTSQHVRLAVAQTLSQAANEGRQVAAQTVATAQDLARDASGEVQRQAVDSLATWPLEQAGPVLLLAIAEGGYTARKTAAKQLAERWPPAADFPVDAVADRRAAAVLELKNQWVAQYGEIQEAVANAKAQAQGLIDLTQERVDEIQSLVASLNERDLATEARHQAVATLTAAGPQLVAALEQQASRDLPPELFDEVLPNVNATFSILQRMTAKDVMLRRTAATELAAGAANLLLPPLALSRLAELTERETDPVVWRSALMTVANDARGDAIQMAYTAIGNASVEVRRRACENLGLHGDPRHVAVLLPALEDTDATVVIAATRALGSVGRLDDPAPLVRLLSQNDRQLRLEAATSLARLRYEQGNAALERLALDNDMEVRLRAATAMGQVADRSFVTPLIAMLNDRADVQRVALVSLAQVVGSDVAASEDGTVLSNEEKVRRWQFWYRDHPPGPNPDGPPAQQATQDPHTAVR